MIAKKALKFTANLTIMRMKPAWTVPSPNFTQNLIKSVKTANGIAFIAVMSKNVQFVKQ